MKFHFFEYGALPVIFLLIFLPSFVYSQDAPPLYGYASLASLNPAPPGQTVRLVFIHHSTGQNWLADDNGGLGAALADNNYFVSDTNYGWGPASIGDHTDIGDWWSWFRGPESAAYLSSLYAEAEQNSSYSRLPDQPAGDNEIVMFKSCFPNSALQGNPGDPPPAIESNPLKGVGSGSNYHTVANAKGIYIDLLEYFKTRQDKLFVVIAAPPLIDSTYADNARIFNGWLANDWLRDYPYHNVAVFDFFNVLTTNGGTPDVNDLDGETGNHHRWRMGSIQYVTDGDNDTSPNVLEYPSGDDHPSRAGNLKATGEFVTLLNVFYHNWKAGSVPIVADGDMDGLGGVTIADALLALKTVVGLHTADAAELSRGNCAPLVNGVPQPDNSLIDIKDALLILRKVVQLIDW